MKLDFFKYQGTGNDFVIIDNRNLTLSRENKAFVEKLCDRKFGIGADGLILLQNHPEYDFEMVYYNSDGRESSMCGNGGRCIAAFAAHLDLVSDHCRFLAIDGPHEAKIIEGDWVELKMSNVNSIEVGEDYFLLDTGSPHFVVFVEDVDDINVVENGQAIRYSKRFKEEGVNVNFVESSNEGIIVATYERGVEDETLSCGTGVAASAISFAYNHPDKNEVDIQTKGGVLKVRLEQTESKSFENIWLCGKAELVFTGVINIDV